MALVFPVVQDPATQQHRPNGADVLDPSSLPVATNTLPGIVAALATPAEAIAGINNTKAITPFDLAAVIATLNDIKISNMTYNAATGELVVTRSDTTVLTVVISDVEVVVTAAPPIVVSPEISNRRYGANTSHLGEPDGWFLFNGKRVPFYN